MPPFGHSTQLRVFVDPDLLQYGELWATRVIALSINEASAKVRTGGAVNEPDDADQPYWSGHVPLTLVFGTPVTNDDSSAPIPPQIADLEGRDAHT